jgi:hypothetical protein
MKKRFVVTTIIAVMVLAAPLSAQQIEYVGSTLWRNLNDMVVDSHYVYCAFENGIAIYDISDPDTPVQISQYYFQTCGSRIAIFDNYILLGDKFGNLIIINAINPQHPYEVTRLILSENVTRIFTKANYAYLLTDASDMYNVRYNIYIIDLTVISHPSIISSISLAGLHTQIFIHGDYIYTTSNFGSMEIYDISDPFQPQLASTYLDSNFVIRDLMVNNNYAYCIDMSLSDSLYILDVSIPYSPIKVNAVANGICESNLVIHGNKLYLGDIENVRVFDITSPEDPIQIATWPMPYAIRFNLAIANNFLIRSNRDRGISIYEQNFQGQAEYIGGHNLIPETDYLFTSGDYAYAGGINGLIISELHDPYNPVFIDSLFLGNWIQAKAVWLSDTILFVSGLRTLFEINIADPANPEVIYTFNMLNSYRVTFRDNFMYNLSTDSLTIFDISNRTYFLKISSYPVHGNYRKLCIFDRYIYAINDTSLKIINIHDPTIPFLAGEMQLPAIIDNLYIQNSLLFLVSDTSFIYDLTNPTIPQLLSSFGPIFSNYLSFNGNYVFGLANNGFVGIFNISNPSQPTFITSYDTPGHPCDIGFSNNNIIVADEYSLLILRFSPNDIENDYSTILSSFSLSPNYPNPFNSSTTIRYNLRTESPVTIDIYDILGRKVQTLLDVKEQAGSRQVNWNAGGLPSGAYFARLKAGEQSQTTKMILMK